jgi:small-conductance mechanosensitive channel
VTTVDDNILILTLRAEVASLKEKYEIALNRIVNFEDMVAEHRQQLAAQAAQPASLLDVYRQNMQLVSEQAEQIAELVDYAKGLREALEGMYLSDDQVGAADANTVLAKPTPKVMKEEN